ncbi:MAG: Uroporphyrin-III C/tetrapyrrole (Corrin/Porphyrin) methyltransferase [Bryobacterales bacterium]|nr:Uroporphyrin-III C/tetrapyrrole (Corrin/Porphyrin) methyltransferase [Bryobacterales bacterium]
MPGILYLVASPIGNLEDITFRAVRILKECDLIACEDTRHTLKLLNHYGIEKPLISYHDYNESQRAAELVARLRDGSNLALISDAGMPLVADPGYRLVTAAVAAGISVQPIPGPSALVTALAASGLPTDSFRFEGFLPAKSGQRSSVLETLKSEQATLIFYEAPHRILDTLADVDRIMGARPVVVARELTKTHEEFLRGTAQQVLEILRTRNTVKGEITLLIGKAAKSEAPLPEPASIEEAVSACEREGLTRMDAIKAVARRHGLSKREVYQRVNLTPGR